MIFNTNIRLNFKRVLLSAVLIFVIFCSKASALNDIVNSFQSNNLTTITNHFNDNVEINFANNNNNLRKFQAEVVLNEFISKNRVMSFSINSTRENPMDNSTYYSGNLSTMQTTFKVTIAISNVNSPNYKITSITFDKSSF